MRREADVVVIPLGGKATLFAGVEGDRFLEADLRDRKVREVPATGKLQIARKELAMTCGNGLRPIGLALKKVKIMIARPA